MPAPGSSDGVAGQWHRYRPLFVILLAYLALGSLYAGNTPAWQAPDEPAHYNYVRQLAAGTLPVIEPDDYDEEYRSQAVSSRFAADYPIEPLTYEDWQPPLYYLFLTPVFVLSDGSLLALRLTSLLFGLGILLCTYATARLLWSHASWLVLTATAFVAFLPQHLAILASVNNDSLSELIVALILWQLSSNVVLVHSGMGPRPWRWYGLGVLLGLGFVTKLTVYIMAPVILITLLLLYGRQWPTVLHRSLSVFAPAALLGAIWWVRNLITYEGFDPLATMAHDAAVVGQQRTSEWIASYGLWETIQRFATTTFRSFWGQFGWMGVLMEPRIYQLLLFFSMLIILGLLWRATFTIRQREQPKHDGRNRTLRRTLLVTLLLNLLLYLGYNVTFVQHQGRYLFVSLIPIAIGVAAGIEAWVQPVTTRWPAATVFPPLLFALALIGLDILALFRYIVPQLTAT